MNFLILFAEKADLDQVAPKIGDILKFKADGVIVYGIYLDHRFSRSDMGDGITNGYTIYSIIAFDSGVPNEYYDWEYESNLTGDD